MRNVYNNIGLYIKLVDDRVRQTQAYVPGAEGTGMKVEGLGTMLIVEAKSLRYITNSMTN